MTATVVSRWYRSERNDMVFEGTATKAWFRAVDGGHLRAYVAHDRPGWHISISFVDGETNRPTRLPSHEELWHARNALVPDDVTMAIVMHRVVYAGEGLPTLLHLHEIPWPPAAKR